jgi:hypothetical protein
MRCFGALLPGALGKARPIWCSAFFESLFHLGNMLN